MSVATVTHDLVVAQTRALKLPGVARAFESLARQARDDFQAARYAAARDKLREALKRSPSNPALWSYLGLAEAQLNDLDSAIADFQNQMVHAICARRTNYRRQPEPGD